MIISASRRTDIPAFYGEWFMNRIEENYVLVRNPFNKKQVTKLIIHPEIVECIVFWTKNPIPFMKYIKDLMASHFNFYFLFTITPYSNDLEQNIPSTEKIADCFKKLSETIGPEKIIWRYDPVILTHELNYAFHLRHFEALSKTLANYTHRCIVSFLTMYKKCQQNLKDIEIITPAAEEKVNLLNQFIEIAELHKIRLQTCATETFPELNSNIKGKCIDNELISNICKKAIPFKKDSYQRNECLCGESVDIGVYNSCQGYCLYCYANQNQQVVDQIVQLHNPSSPMLIGNVESDDKVVERNSPDILFPLPAI
jgi:hypothetical protein